MKIPATIKTPDALLAELCGHLTDMAAAALNGDAEAQAWLVGGFPGHRAWFAEFWKPANLSLDQQIDALDQQIARSMSRMAELQEQRSALAREIHAAKHAHLRRELLGGIAQRDRQEAQAQQAAVAAKYEAQRRAEWERSQAADDAAKRLARSVQERERIDAEAAARRSRELATVAIH